MLFIYINNSPSNYSCACTHTLSFCTTRPSSGIVLDFWFFEYLFLAPEDEGKREFHDAPHVYFWRRRISLDDRRRRRRHRASPCRCCRCCWFRFRYQIKFTFKVSGDQRSVRLDVRHACSHQASGWEREKVNTKWNRRKKESRRIAVLFCHLFLSRILSVFRFWFIHFVTLFHSHCSYPLRM